MKNTLSAGLVLLVCTAALLTDCTGEDGTNLAKLVQENQLPNRDSEADPVNAAMRLLAEVSGHPTSEWAGEAYYMAGVLYLHAEEWEESLDAYSSAFETGSLSPLQGLSALFSMAQCKRSLGDLDAALDFLKKMHEGAGESADLHSTLERGANGEETAYFNTVYSLLASSFLEATDVLLEKKDRAGAADNLLNFFHWYDRMHPRKVFYQADRDLGLDCSAPFVETAAQLYMFAPAGRETAFRIYETYRDHWAATPEERFIYHVRFIDLSPKTSYAKKAAAMEELIRHDPENEMVPQAKERLAHYAESTNNLDLAVELWGELANLEGKQREHFDAIVQSALLQLAYHHLSEGNADEGEDYLDRIASEFPGSRAHDAATRMGLGEWVERVRSGR